MAVLKTYVCDCCGAIKKDSNSWYVIITTDYPESLTLTTFEAAKRREPSYPRVDLCSRQCVAKKVEQFLEAASEGHDDRSEKGEDFSNR